MNTISKTCVLNYERTRREIISRPVFFNNFDQQNTFTELIYCLICLLFITIFLMTSSDIKEKKRLDELHRLDLLDTKPEKEYDEIVVLASLICETPISLITLIDTNRQWFKARVGLDIQETRREVAFCDQAIKKEGLMIVENALEDERFANNQMVLEDPHIRFYAGAPLITSKGYKLGTLCVFDRKPKKLTHSQQFSLQILAKQVVKQIEFSSLNNKLKITSERLKHATEGAQVGTFEYDLVKNTLICDAVLYSLYGVKPYTYPTAFDAWRAHLHPKDYEITNQKIQAAIRGEIKFDTEFRVIWPDGSVHYIKSKAEILREPGGKATRMLGANWDITAQKQTERELKLSNERDRIFVEQSPNAIAMFDTDMRYMAASEQWIKDYKLSNVNIIGRSHYEIFPEISEDWKKIHADCMKGKINKCEEAYFERADGVNQWITWDIRPWYISEDIIGGLMMYTADITKAKERELEKLRVEEILNKTNEIARIGTWEAVLGTRKVTWSKITKEIHGVPENYQPDFDYELNFFPEGENRDNLIKAIDTLIKFNKPYDLELEIITTTGERKWVRSIGQAEFEHGVCKRVYGMFQDIHESKKAKEAIIEAKNLAEQSALLKETFLANMSHEIRTPMNAIVGFTNLLLKKDLGDEEREYMQIVKNSGENLLRIINDILDISKINSGMMTFEEHPLNISEIFASLRLMLLQKATEKGIGLSFDTPPSLSLNILGDPTRLTQILLNLLGNAIKFTQKGSVKIKASLVSEDKESFVVKFSVKDTGIGIAKDKLNYIFDRFSQAEQHTTRTYGGTGLGLSIAKQLIELQHGTIECISEPGEGSDFIFTLPFKKTTTHLKNQLNSIKLEKARFDNLKVLIVDDNPINIKLIKGMFSEFKMQIETAENGLQAVEKVRQSTYDLVLMDIEMPEMSGYEASEHIRKTLGNNVPIIAMSAHAMSEEKERSLQLGMNDYISKPLKAELLFEKILQAVSTDSSLKKQERLVNLDPLKASIHGRNDLLREILDLFLQGVPDDLDTIYHAIGQSAFDTIKRRAHRMKSTILAVGIAPLTTILTEIETLSTSATSIHRIEELYTELLPLCRQALEEVDMKKKKLS
ncbi:hypothetical protein CNR22_00580 [Sphingobacteriaceae bacterium]|nr:hypothetical protein CNR22_00580 [Sphingobacteriaceae bacterium]